MPQDIKEHLILEKSMQRYRFLQYYAIQSTRNVCFWTHIFAFC